MTWRRIARIGVKLETQQFVSFAADVARTGLSAIGFVEERVGKRLHDANRALFIIFFFFVLLVQGLRVVNEVVQTIVLGLFLFWTVRPAVDFLHQAGSCLHG